MKELLFGLLLTVCASGFSYGNTIIENEDLKKNEESQKVATCYTQHIVIVENSCGVFEGLEMGRPQGVECGVGQAPGSTTTTYSKKVVLSLTPCM
ncbi:hypothetical protein [Chryseobacterium sp. FH1]|uniref:hypothetical protein n=1 Tax=Chryseobacterium sp. FH1 TaxID=1233951 RepID=UPI0004E30EC1|nr:hypothetical protein [Chryseobacterium sp. FH1]KFC20679.1 hypothetical protein IO90_16200 [Chryseobacterium sp. FH1]